MTRVEVRAAVAEGSKRCCGRGWSVRSEVMFTPFCLRTRIKYRDYCQTVVKVTSCCPQMNLNSLYLWIGIKATLVSSGLSWSSDQVRGAEQPPGQVHRDDAVEAGTLPSGPGQHAAPRLQDQEHRGVSRAGHLRRCEPSTASQHHMWWHHCIAQNSAYWRCGET